MGRKKEVDKQILEAKMTQKASEMDQFNPITEVEFNPLITVTNPIRNGVIEFCHQQITEIPGSCWIMFHSITQGELHMGTGSS